MNWWTAFASHTPNRAPLPIPTKSDQDISSIVGDTRQFFSVDLTRRIAIHRRLTRQSVESGVALALPFLLAALSGVASHPSGARKLASSVEKQYPATLETIRSGIGCERQDVAGAYGWGYMAQLVGREAFAAVCSNVARLSRLSDQETKLLVGLVGWVLMSQLRLEQRRQDLTPSALAHLLASNCGARLTASGSQFG